MNDWRDHAACLGTDPDMFFPEKHDDAGAAAKRVCNSCPVIAECLAYALVQEPAPAGIWGGISYRPRQRLRARIAAAGTAA